MSADPALLRWLGNGLAAAGFFTLLLLGLLDPASALRRHWARYVRALDRDVRFLRLRTRGVSIALSQLGIVSALGFAGAWLEEPLLYGVIAPVVALPYLWLRRRHARRVVRIEEQIDGWLVLLANALRAAPSLGDAIGTSALLVEAPLAEELDETVKEMRLGTPVDRAVLNLGTRVGSRPVQGALAALLVGRQTGGDLSGIIEETAASMREMTRLEGILRAKTAEGRAQAYVLGAIPFFLLAAIHWVDPHWLEPLTETTLGLLVTTVSAGLWLSAILLARRILAVDL